jgi:hypothetical protein
MTVLTLIALKAQIDAQITTNGNGDVTGLKLNGNLQDIVDSILALAGSLGGSHQTLTAHRDIILAGFKLLFSGGNTGFGLTSPDAVVHVRGGSNANGRSFWVDNIAGEMSLQVKNDKTVLMPGFVGIGSQTLPSSVLMITSSTSAASTPFAIKADNGNTSTRFRTSNTEVQLYLRNATTDTDLIKFSTDSDSYFNHTGNLGVGLDSGISAKLQIKGQGVSSVDKTFLISNGLNAKTIEVLDSTALGFHGASPTLQADTTIPAANFVAGAGASALHGDMYDGYTIAQIVRGLREKGIFL